MRQRKDIRNIYVYAHWVGMKEPGLMGELKAESDRGKEIFSFSYAEDWLNHVFHKFLIWNRPYKESRK